MKEVVGQRYLTTSAPAGGWGCFRAPQAVDGFHSCCLASCTEACPGALKLDSDMGGFAMGYSMGYPGWVSSLALSLMSLTFSFYNWQQFQLILLRILLLSPCPCLVDKLSVKSPPRSTLLSSCVANNMKIYVNVW